MPGAHHVQMRVRQIEKAAAVAGVAELHRNFPLLQRAQHFVETRELEIGEGLVRFIRLREMGHRAFEQQRFLGENLFDERQRLVPAHAVTAHAGVDFDVDRHAVCRSPPRCLRQLADGVRLVHANGQVVRDAPFEFGLLPFAEQQQRRLDAGVAQGHRLFERAQAEAPRAFFERDARHVERAVAVSLVLHHGEQFHVTRQVAADEPEIVAQPAEVNLGPRRPLRKICQNSNSSNTTI